jgi:hypothetical protein
MVNNRHLLIELRIPAMAVNGNFLRRMPSRDGGREFTREWVTKSA